MAHDPKTSARMMADWLAEHPVAGPVLLVDDLGPIAEHLDGVSVDHRSWLREARAGAAAHAWCPDGPFQAAVIRLPKGREAQQMVLHAVAARLAPDAVCYVHGHNDEGIKSAKRPCEEVFLEAQAVDARRHCRIWECRGDRAVGKGELADWMTEVSAKIPGGHLTWNSWPGLFAHGRLDHGTQQLLRALPKFEPGTAILDWACGAGVVAKAVLERSPGVTVDMLDLDALALHAARQNVPEAGGAWLSDGWLGVPEDRRWDVIITNPPWHAGVSTDWTALQDLIKTAPARLNPSGSLWMVTQRNVRVEVPLKSGFRKVKQVVSTPGFRVWHATRH